jgi:spermidine synthase
MVADKLPSERRRTWFFPAISALAVPCAVLFVFFGHGYKDKIPHSIVKRDHTATVVAYGSGMEKRLLVNGVGITSLTPITKVMAHLPLASLSYHPHDALTICFGMGTTYRSMLSWGVRSTAVELVPSVVQLFGFYHEDGPDLLRSPLGELVIDDGRRYLEHTSKQFDVIIIDPPPPVEAAGSSLLYSQEFYSIIRRHLRSGGILQQWIPYGDRLVLSSVARALKVSFSNVRVFGSVQNKGFHFLASDARILSRKPSELTARMPAAAIEDLVEWGPAVTAETQLATILRSEFTLESMIALASQAMPLRDDHPVNEYYLLREIFEANGHDRIERPSEIADQSKASELTGGPT